MAHAKKFLPRKKNKVEIRTDANQGIREHNARVAKQRAYEAKKNEEMMAEYRKMLEARNAQQASTVAQ